MALDMAPGEQSLGSWTLFYLPPDGGKNSGKLTVTNQRLVYNSKHDATFANAGARAKGDLEIAKDDIQDVEVLKKLLSKKAIVTLRDGSRHVFDYGAMNIDKVVAAIQSR